MATINQTQCQTDKILTDATLRGVQHISYNKMILDLKNDIENLQALHKKLDIKEPKTLAEIGMKLHAMEQQANNWIEQVGFKPHRDDYAITILIEQVKIDQD